MKDVKSKWGLYGFVHEAGEIWCTDDWTTAFTLRLVRLWKDGTIPVEQLQELAAALQKKIWPDWAVLMVDLFERGELSWDEAWDATQRLCAN